MRVRLENIKAVKDHVYEFEQNGIYSFTGSNGNGKSALTDAITAITSMSFYDLVGRKSLISWWSDWARITITTDNAELSVYLVEPRADCRMTYTINGDSQTVSFNDKGGLEAIIKKCGFGGFGEKRISIQVHNAFGDVPFITTGPRVDAELIESITKDEFAVRCQENFHDITAPAVRRTFENYNTIIEGLEQDIRLLTGYNIQEEEEKIQKLKSLEDLCDFEEPKFKSVFVKKLSALPEFRFRRINVERKSYIEIPKFRKVNINKLITINIPKFKSVKNKQLSVIQLPVFKRLYIPTITEADFVDGNCPLCGSKVL